MPDLSPETQTARSLGVVEAQRQCSAIVGRSHLFIALVKQNGIVASARRAGSAVLELERQDPH